MSNTNSKANILAIKPIPASSNKLESVAEEPEVDETTNTRSEALTRSELAGNSVVPLHYNAFTILVGRNREKFVFDMSDMRCESRLFRHSVSISGVELLREKPAAVRLIHNWFKGKVGAPPLTKEERNLFIEAANIAKQLQIRECENQILIIIHKAAMSLADILMQQIRTGDYFNGTQVAELVGDDMRGYMYRSPNVGGEIKDESDDE